MLHLAVEAVFEDLLAQWRAHHDRQTRAKCSVEELAASRASLDVTRERMHRFRLAMYPESDECESIVESIWCESLDAVVFLRWADRDPIRPGNFRCVCGHLVPIDWERVVENRAMRSTSTASALALQDGSEPTPAAADRRDVRPARGVRRRLRR